MPGNVGSFKELVENNQETKLFVDKTLFIQEIINSKTDPLLITRPRRWGKTINMNMLLCYFINRHQLMEMGRDAAYVKQCDNLFENLNISNPILNPNLEETKKHLGKYPTIFISFDLSGEDASKDDIARPDWEKIKKLIVVRIGELFSEFDYIAKDLNEKINNNIRDSFNKNLSKNIEKYKEEFNLQELSTEERIKIYDKTSTKIKDSQEQINLDRFNRIRSEKSEGSDLSLSINFLAKLLSDYHKQPVYILIDEYDTLINRYFNHPNIVDELTKTFSGMFSAFAKPNKTMNDYIQKVVFTGILRVAKANIFSGLNNLTECTVLDETFSQYYGFTKTELIALLEKANKNDSLSDVERWYNGYKIGKETIYNPWSVMRFIRENSLEAYWVNTANPGIIKDILLNNKGHAINKLLRDIIKNGPTQCSEVKAKKSVSVEDLRNPESIWSFLIHTGYLTVDATQFNEASGAYKCQVRIPNTEIRTIYNSIICDWLEKQAATQGIIQNLFEEDYGAFADNLQSMLKKQYNSPLFAREENSVEEVYHSLLLMELNKDLIGANYELLPEEYTGDGRADILFVDKQKKQLVAIELKRTRNLNELAKEAETALEQVIKQQYGNDPKYASYEKRPAVGICFCGTKLGLKVQGQNETILL